MGFKAGQVAVLAANHFNIPIDIGRLASYLHGHRGQHQQFVPTSKLFSTVSFLLRPCSNLALVRPPDRTWRISHRLGNGMNRGTQMVGVVVLRTASVGGRPPSKRENNRETI